jgi:hypothetical protein
METNFFAGPDDGVSKLAALQRLLLTNELPQAPSVLLAPDATGRIQIMPSTTLPEASITLEGADTPVRVGLFVPFKASRKLWIPEAAELEELVNDPSVTEQQLQEFF